jgi:polysaccharide chain length determinant protein (PEP-CTERM system associated)
MGDFMSQGVDFSKYHKMLMKRRYLFLAVSVAVASVIAWGSFLLPKQFEASSTVFIESSIIRDLVKGITITPNVNDKVRVLKYAMLSRTFVLNTLKAIDLDTKAKNDAELEKMIKHFQTSTQISVKGNDLFIVTYRDQDPVVATDYVNTLVRKYVEENVSLKRQDSYGADQFLTEQLTSLKVKVDKADDDIVKFRQLRGVAVATDESSLVKDINTFKSELDVISIKRKELSAVQRSLNRQLKTEDRFTVAVMSSRAPEGGSQEIRALENKVKQLLVNYTENYPEVIRLRGVIESLKKQQKQQDSQGQIYEPELSTMNPLFQNLKQQAFQVESELDALNARQRQLQGLIASKSGELRNVPADQKKLSDLVKERDATRQIYEQLMLRQGQAELSKQMEVEDKATTFRIVDPAVLAKKPVSPNRVRLIIMGLLAGIGAGFGIVFLKEMLDSSIKDLEVLKGFGYEVLAVIPTMVNPVVQQETQRRDRKVYAVAAGFVAVIILLLAHEVLELTLIERVMGRLGIDRMFTA